MVKLTANKIQYKKSSYEMESSLSITVDYDPQSDTVEGIHEVNVYNFNKHCSTDITAIMAEQFSNQLDSMIDSINWREEYSMQASERREAV